MAITWAPETRISFERNPIAQASQRPAARPHQDSLDWVVASSAENALEFEQARLTPSARRRALQVRSIVQAVTRHLTRDIEEDIIALHEGGVSLNFDNTNLKREAVFVVPPGGEVLYFIARGADRFRRAGIVLGDPAIARLARWASSQSVEFSSRDLEIG